MLKSGDRIVDSREAMIWAEFDEGFEEEEEWDEEEGWEEEEEEF